jgi:arylsulfatase A-like enzyme
MYFFCLGFEMQSFAANGSYMTNYKKFSLKWMILQLLISSIFGSGVCAAEAIKPNVLFIVADDQRADTIHALGNKLIKTPNLDQLVHEGMSFHRAYCLGANSGAVCTPSRNMFMSGQVYFRWGGKSIAAAEGPNFPVAMKTHGYETYHTGKKGNTATLIQATFEHLEYINENQERLSGEHGKAIVANAVGFLEKRDKSRPFFMYLGLEGPHDPRVAAASYLGMYKPEEIPLPKNFLPYHPFDNGALTIRDEALAPWPRTEMDTRKQLHEYYACITSIDTHLGKLFSKLKADKLYDNTIVIYSSDHGLAVGSHGLFGKQNLYEDGMRVPLVVRGPGVKHGETQAMCYLHDIFPTVCELTGAKLPDKIDGRSFASVLRGETNQAREHIVLSYQKSQRAFNDGRFKIMQYPQINRTQLFDLEADPEENSDIAAKHPDKVKELMAKLALEQTILGDTDPLTSENPKPGDVTAETINGMLNKDANGAKKPKKK